MQKQKLKLYTNGEILEWRGHRLGWSHWGYVFKGVLWGANGPFLTVYPQEIHA